MFGVRWRYVFILLLALYSYVQIVVTESDSWFPDQDHTWLLLGNILVLSLGVWEGNRLLQKVLPRLATPLQDKVNPLLIHFTLSLIWVAILGTFTYYVLIPLAAPEVAISFKNFKLLIGFAFRINLFLHCVNAIFYYMNKTRQAQLEAEQLKKTTLEAQFASLRNQVNPHFLFNSLNTLTNLVRTDPDGAMRFIAELSKVYRYLLNHRDQKLVDLDTELSFIEAYLYLLRIRFRDTLNVHFAISDASKRAYIVPASLQIVVENAIKHNEVSLERPLSIKIYDNGNGHLMVWNNLQEKRIKEPSSGVGLENIQRRYRFLTEQEVKIEKEPNHFLVHLPLVKVG